MKFVAKEKAFSGKLFSPGMNYGTVSSIEEDVPSGDNNPWNDVTPQVKAVVRNKTGFITIWFNLKGYKNATDFPDGVAPKGHEFVSSENGNEEYLMNSKTKVRVEDEVRTEQAVSNLLDFAAKCGVVGEFDFPDLLDKQVGVMVRERGTRVEAHYFVKFEDVAEEVTA